MRFGADAGAGIEEIVLRDREPVGRTGKKGGHGSANRGAISRRRKRKVAWRVLEGLLSPQKKSETSTGPWTKKKGVLTRGPNLSDRTRNSCGCAIVAGG